MDRIDKAYWINADHQPNGTVKSVESIDMSAIVHFHYTFQGKDRLHAHEEKVAHAMFANGQIKVIRGEAAEQLMTAYGQYLQAVAPNEVVRR